MSGAAVFLREDTVAERCPASFEAVEEAEDRGETGCPICGRPAEEHEHEVGGDEVVEFEEIF